MPEAVNYEKSLYTALSLIEVIREVEKEGLKDQGEEQGGALSGEKVVRDFTQAEHGERPGLKYTSRRTDWFFRKIKEMSRSHVDNGGRLSLNLLELI